MIVSTLETVLLDSRIPPKVHQAVKQFLILLATGPDDGAHELGDGCRAILSRPTTVEADSLPYETHRHVTDVHVVLSGWEAVHGACPSVLVPAGPYNEAEDFTLFWPSPGATESEVGRFVLGPRMLAIFGPGEAHKPRGAVGLAAPFRKVVLKVPE